MQINLRKLDAQSVSISIDELTTIADIDQLFAVLNNGSAPGFSASSLAASVSPALGPFTRSSAFLQQPIFNSYQCEHEMLR
jgi:glycine dehydrogenase